MHEPAPATIRSVKPDQTSRANTAFATAIAHHQAGRLDQAAAAYREVLRVAPGHADALHLLGLIEAQHGRLGQALPLLQEAARRRPRNAEITLNLANALMASGQANQALDAYRTATRLRPDFREARAALVQALSRVAAFLESESRYGDAIPLWREAITIAPDVEAHWRRLAGALETVVFIKRDPLLHDVLCRLLGHQAVNPNWFYVAVLSYLRLTPGFDQAMAEPDPPTEIAGEDLFFRLLQTAIVAEPEIERTLTRWRAAALRRIATGGQAPVPLPLLCALAEQCFVTEYVYVETAEESGTVARIESDIAATIAAGGDIEPGRVTILAAYRPLHRLPGAAALAARRWPPPLEAVIRHQVTEPLEERRLRESIPALTEIHDRVSQAVRDQYEENPYPRWRSVARPRQALGVAERVGTASPEILIAGCGTGHHSALTAMRFPTGRILAVDLSLTSLAYALRRTRELGLAGVEYAQADILGLATLDRRFDIVESIGVLHHLGDPLAGWRILSELVKPGGMMFIGLYSKLARRPIVEARHFIAKRAFDATQDGIRRARQAILAEMDESITRRLRTNIDFYSLSGCRDLLFHVQEHRFTIPRIAAALDQLQLSFDGFGSVERDTVSKYRARFPDDPDMRSLTNWDAFERDNPDSFPNMYQFWARKPSNPAYERDQQ